jgi:hypothetical protein
MRLRPTAPATQLVPTQMPRDVEALESVIAALDNGVTSELDAHRITLETIVSATGMDYGAVWVPAGGGESRSARRPAR